jgi:hypothetical protein
LIAAAPAPGDDQVGNAGESGDGRGRSQAD